MHDASWCVPWHALLHDLENMSALKLVAKWLLLPGQSECGTETDFLSKPITDLGDHINCSSSLLKLHCSQSVHISYHFLQSKTECIRIFIIIPFLLTCDFEVVYYHPMKMKPSFNSRTYFRKSACSTLWRRTLYRRTLVLSSDLSFLRVSVQVWQPHTHHISLAERSGSAVFSWWQPCLGQAETNCQGASFDRRRLPPRWVNIA